MRDPKFVCDLFSRLLEERLRVSLGGPISVQVDEARMAKLTGALEQAETPALYAVAKTREGHFGGVMTLTAPVIHQAIEAMTGAPAGSRPADRAPTAIDEALIANLAEDVIYCFERAMSSGPRPDGGAAIDFDCFTRKPTSLTEAPDSLDTLVFSLTLSLGQEPMETQFIVPLGVLDIYRAAETRAALKRPPIGDSAARGALWSTAMLTAARTAEYRLIGVLQELTLTIEEVGELVPGSVIPLPPGARMEVGLRIDSPQGVAGAPDVAFGPLGTSEGKRAVKIAVPPADELIRSLTPFAGDD